MADFTNRQLAEIIARSAEKINSNLLKEQKISNEFSDILEKLEYERYCLETKIQEIRKIEIKPDLSALNSLYHQSTKDNIKRLNSRLKVPNLALYVWLSAVALIIISFFTLHLAYRKAFKTKADIQEEYRRELLKENAIVPKAHEQLLKDMNQFFQNNPKTKDKFMQWRQENK